MIGNSYWYNKGYYQDALDEMHKAEAEDTFTFTKKTLNVFHSYYRYFNDGDFPGWARGRYELMKTGKRGKTELNNKGLIFQEERVNERVLAEFKRYRKTHPLKFN